MLKRKHLPIGMEFDGQAVKAVQLGQEKERFFLIGYAMEKFPQGALQGGTVKKASGLKEALERLAGKGKFKGRAVNFVIGGQQVNLRPLTLPRLPFRELAEAVYWEADKYLGDSVEDPVVDFLVLREKEEDELPMLELLVAAVPRKTVEDYLELLEGAGFEPLALEIRQLPLFRLVKRLGFLGGGSLGGGGCCLALDIGEEETSLVIMDKEKILYGRTILLGRRHFEEGIQELPAGETLLSGERGKISLAESPQLTKGAEALFADVERSLRYFLYQMENREKELKDLYLAGEGSSLLGLPVFLGEALNLKPHLVDPLHLLEQREGLPEGFVQEAPSLSLALGASLRGYTP